MLDATSGQTHHVTLHGGTLRGGTFLGGPLLHGVLDGLLCAGKLRVKHYYMVLRSVSPCALRCWKAPPPGKR